MWFGLEYFVLLVCLFLSDLAAGCKMRFFTSRFREQPKPVKRFCKCTNLPHAVHFHNPFPLSLCFPTKRHAQTCNVRCFRNRSLCLWLSVLFHPLSHVQQGKQHSIVLFLHGRRECSWARQRVIVLLERKHRIVSHSPGMFWRLIPERIFWCARWITRRVWLHAGCLPHQLTLPLLDAGTPKPFTTTLPLWVCLFSPPNAPLGIGPHSLLLSSAAVESEQDMTVFRFLAVLFLPRKLYIINIWNRKSIKKPSRYFFSISLPTHDWLKGLRRHYDKQSFNNKLTSMEPIQAKDLGIVSPFSQSLSRVRYLTNPF